MGPMRLVQLHLVTLLAMSFTAAGLLWLNVRCSPGYPYIADYDISGDIYDPIIKRWPSVGWPYSFVYFEGQITFIAIDPRLPSLPIQSPGSGNDGPRIRVGQLLKDLAIALGIVLSVAVFCEWTLRRRAKRSAPKVLGRDAQASLT